MRLMFIIAHDQEAEWLIVSPITMVTMFNPSAGGQQPPCNTDIHGW